MTGFLLPLALEAGLSDVPRRIAEIVGDADVGIAVVTSDGENYVRNGDEYFDMASVMKFHQAAALARVMDFDSIMNATVRLSADDLHKDTWSPMRASVQSLPYDASLVELLDYSLNFSDNNAADVIFNRYMAPAEVERVLRESSLASDIKIRSTEAQMHSADVYVPNETTPLDAAKCIYRFFTADTTASATLVKAIMARETPFGTERITAGVERGAAKVFHKTGTGFENPDGSLAAINDLAFVSYKRPGGYSCYAIAVFVRDFKGSKSEGEQLIADISRAVWSAVIVGESMAMGNSAAIPTRKGGPAAASVEKYTVGDALFDITTNILFDVIDRKISGE